MNAAILIATFGDEQWSELAMRRAYPSALAQGVPVVVYHGSSLAQARNAAAGMVETDWLCFLDADDELCPGYVAAMAAALKHEMRVYSPAPGYVSAPIDLYDAVPLRLLAPAVSYDGSRARIPNLGRWPDANECVIGTLVPRAVFMRVGGFEELPSLEDYSLWLRCVKAGARIVHVPDAVYCAHVTPGSRNSDQSVYAQLREEHAEVWAQSGRTWR